MTNCLPGLRESNEGRAVPEKKESTPSKKAKTPKKKAKGSSDHESQDDDGPSSSKKPRTADKKSKAKDKKQEDKTPSPESERDVKYAAKDNSFREFRKLCAEISEIASYTSKTEAVKEFFDKGTGKGKFLF